MENFLPFSSNSKLLSAALSVWKSLKFVVWERVKVVLNPNTTNQQFNHTCHTSRIVRDSPGYMPYVPDCPGQSWIHAIRPGLSGTVLDFDTLSRRPGNCEIVPEILKNKVNRFLRPIEREGFVINSCLNDKCYICCRVPIISGIPVVIDRH